MIEKKRLYNTLQELVAVPGVSGTEAEIKTAHKIEELLYNIPYFKNHREEVRLIPLENDPLDRVVVTAYLESKVKTSKTIILTGHYDVVDVEEYGQLKNIAFDIESITKRIGELPLDEDSRKDFESGEWIFGRGTADMKCGISLCLELLRHYSEEGNLAGNLLFVAVPGEETNSEGMLAAVPFFTQFEKEKNIHYSALLLTECYMMDDQANDQNRYIHFGASGKVMPMYFFVGEATHGGEPFLGIDPSLLSNEVYRIMHLNTDFCQQNLGETTPPPVCLKMQDLKTTYSVSTPLYTAAYYNIVTITMNPEQVMEKLLNVGKQAFDNALRYMKARVEDFEALTGAAPITIPVEPCVKTFYELYSEVKKTYDGDLDEHIKEFSSNLTMQKMEMQDISIKIVKEVYELYKDKKPMIIVSIIPPYYPDICPSDETEDAKQLLKAVNKVISYADKKYGQSLKLKNYYMGISDLCYIGLAKDRNFDKIFENLVGINQIYSFPQEALKEFNVPGIVLGGYGKDFHKHTERLHKKYNFEIWPDLYLQVIDSIFE